MEKLDEYIGKTRKRQDNTVSKEKRKKSKTQVVFKRIKREGKPRRGRESWEE